MIAPAEHVGEAIGQRHEKNIADQRQRHLVIAERRAAQSLVSEPRHREA
jgi:hypothetical protein